MAYAAEITWNAEQPAPGRIRISLYVVETDCAAGDAWTLDPEDPNVTITKAINVENDARAGAKVPIPPTFTVRNWKQHVVDGTAATVRGMIGCPEAPGAFAADTMDLLYQTDAPAAFIHEAGISTVGFPPDRTRRILSGMSVPNAGADNEIHTHIILEGGL